MKKSFLFLRALALIGILAVISCEKVKPTSQANEISTTNEGDLFSLDTENSKVEWTGYKVLKSDNSSHFGHLKFESGEVTLKNGELESGYFVVDMNSLEVDDVKDAEQKEYFGNHLKGTDFFDVGNFPTSSFEITRVSLGDDGDFNTLIDGNLTIKEVTKPISIKAKVDIEKNGLVRIKSDRKDINRQDFGVVYSSSIKNMIIKDDVVLQFDITATKKD